MLQCGVHVELNCSEKRTTKVEELWIESICNLEFGERGNVSFGIISCMDKGYWGVGWTLMYCICVAPYIRAYGYFNFGINCINKPSDPNSKP